jgi:hypothetical protein
VYQQATFYRVRTFSAGYHTVFFFFTQAFHLLSFLFASASGYHAFSSSSFLLDQSHFNHRGFDQEDYL